MNPIKMWNKLSLFTKIMIGFVLGIGAVLVLGESATKLAFLGTNSDQTFNHGGSPAGSGR